MLPVDMMMAVMCHSLFVACTFMAQDADATTAGSMQDTLIGVYIVVCTGLRHPGIVWYFI